MPGRTRLRIAARRGDAPLFAAIATGLSTIPGVSRAEVRPLTGSILIEHGGPFTRIAAAAEKARLFVIANGLSPPRPTAAAVDPKIVAAAGLGIFALWQLAQGHILPPAITLAWYAAGLGGLLSNGDAGEGGE
jgi:hypothetical protein